GPKWRRCPAGAPCRGACRARPPAGVLAPVGADPVGDSTAATPRTGNSFIFPGRGFTVDTRELREQLTELHRELEAATSKSPEGSEVLSHMMTDIVRIAAGEEMHPEEGENLRERLEHQASDFEVRHPRMAGILREITDILARLGI